MIATSVILALGVATALAAFASDRIDRLRQRPVAIQTAELRTDRLENGACTAFAMMRTAREVGGDFYDYYELPDGRTVVTIADVSGKGRRLLILAVMEGTKYHVNEMTLAADDRLLLYTDGVTEAMNAQGKLYGEARL